MSSTRKPTLALVAASAALMCVLTSAAYAKGAPSNAASEKAADKKPKVDTLANCSWDRPGVNPYMGELTSAVDRYTDIPENIRFRLKERIERKQYDDFVTIKRDSIEGNAKYDPEIRDMHFGWNKVCTSVNRAGWTAQTQERGLVYCEGTHCVIVPTVCRNVSRVKKKAVQVASAVVMEPEVIADLPTEEKKEPEASFSGGISMVTLPPVVDLGLKGVTVPVFTPLFTSKTFTTYEAPMPGPLTPVPEPSTWMLMLAGLGIVGWGARRRKMA